MAITITSPHVDSYFSEQQDGSWLCHATGKAVTGPFLDHYKATNGLLTLGLPVSGLIAVENIGIPQVNGTPVEGAVSPFAHFAGHGIEVQFYERGAAIKDKDHLIDNPPGAGEVYRLHVYTASPGVDPRVWNLLAQEAQLQAQLAAEQQKVAPADPLVAQKLSDLTHNLSQINALAAQVAQLSHV